MRTDAIPKPFPPFLLLLVYDKEIKCAQTVEFRNMPEIEEGLDDEMKALEVED